LGEADANYIACKTVADAHNAALAAEREGQQQEKQNLVRKYSDIIAAEREKRERIE
jgi:hypothetical protein